MHYIAQIISNDSKADSGGNPFIRRIKYTDGVTYDDGIPTLVVGYEIAKSMFGGGIKVLDRRISDNVRWTFGRYEKRDIFERDMDAFCKEAVKSLSSNVRYRHFNIFYENKDSVRDFFTYIEDGCGKYIYSDGRDIFIYDSEDNVIYGVSVAQLEYLGRSESSFLRYASSSGCNRIIKSGDIGRSYARVAEGRTYMLPYLHYLSGK